MAPSAEFELSSLNGVPHTASPPTNTSREVDVQSWGASKRAALDRGWRTRPCCGPTGTSTPVGRRDSATRRWSRCGWTGGARAGSSPRRVGRAGGYHLRPADPLLGRGRARGGLHRPVPAARRASSRCAARRRPRLAAAGPTTLAAPPSWGPVWVGLAFVAGCSCSAPWPGWLSWPAGCSGHAGRSGCWPSPRARSCSPACVDAFVERRSCGTAADVIAAAALGLVLGVAGRATPGGRDD